VRKNLLIVFALILTLAFVACSENIIDNTFQAALEPEYPEYEAVYAEIFPEQITELDILKPVTNGNIVDFLILRDGLLWHSYSQTYDVHGILILELSEGLTLAEDPQAPGGLVVHNPENGLLVMASPIHSENDIVLRLTFEGTGTWTLSGTSGENGGSFEFMGSISGEIDGSEAVIDEKKPVINNNEPLPSGGGYGSVGADAPSASAPDMETNDAK